MPELSADIFEIVLLFLYTGQPNLVPEHAVETLSAANLFALPSLKSACSNYIRSSIDPENCVVLINASQRYNATELYNYCLEFIEANADLVFNSEEFLTIDDGVLVDLLNSDSLTLPELDVFQAVLRWGKAQRDIEGNAVDLAKALKPLLELIRFPQMAPDELADIVEPSQVVPSSLLMEAYRHHVVSSRSSEPFAGNARSKPRKGTIVWDFRSGQGFEPHELNPLGVTASSNTHMTLRASRAFSTGRQYWEIHIDKVSLYTWVGLVADGASLDAFMGDQDNGWAYSSNGTLFHATRIRNKSFSEPFSDGDTIGLDLDMETRTLGIWKNGSWMGVAFSSLPSRLYPAISMKDPGSLTACFTPSSIPSRPSPGGGGAWAPASPIPSPNALTNAPPTNILGGTAPGTFAGFGPGQLPQQ